MTMLQNCADGVVEKIIHRIGKQYSVLNPREIVLNCTLAN